MARLGDTVTTCKPGHRPRSKRLWGWRRTLLEEGRLATAFGRYHDEVWGMRTYDESAMFEALTLGGFEVGWKCRTQAL